MIQCPKCKNDIPDDSRYCDQYGEQLMFCPKCADGSPRRGKYCSHCGTLLVPGADIGKQSTAHKTDVFQPQQQQSTASENDAPSDSGTPTQENMSMEDVFSLFSDVWEKTSAPTASHSSATHNPDDFEYVEKDTLFGKVKIKQPKQQATGGALRPQSQQGGAMQMQPDSPKILRMVDDPTKVVMLKANGIIGRSIGDYVDVFGSCLNVSSQHGKIVLHKDGHWLYSDLGSTNGSKINSTQLEPNKYYLLKKGMIVEIGLVKFKVE